MACSSCGGRSKMKISNIIGEHLFVVEKAGVIIGEYESRTLARAAVRKAGLGATIETVANPKVKKVSVPLVEEEKKTEDSSVKKVEVKKVASKKGAKKKG